MMEKKTPYDNTEFYGGYKETAQDIPKDSIEVNYTDKEIALKNKKKLIIFKTLLSVSVCILFLALLRVRNISIGIYDLVAKTEDFHYFIGGVLGVTVSVFLVRRVSRMGEDESIKNKHAVHFTASAVSCGTAVFVFVPWEERNPSVFDTYRPMIVLILLGISLLLTVWGFFLYTKFEKKIFLPLMCVSVLFSIGISFRECIRPRYDISYNVDYYFVSSEELVPKQQKAEYYIADGLDSEEIQKNVRIDFYVISGWEDIDYYIMNCQREFPCDFTFDEHTELVLKKIFGENTPYNIDFFHDNYLVIYCMNYAGTPEKVDIERVFVDNQTIKVKENIYYKPDTVLEGRNEYCLAFIKIPKTQNVKNAVSGLAEMKYHF